MILADPFKHADLIEDMRRLALAEHGNLEYTAGGAGLNSLRCAQVTRSGHICTKLSFLIVAGEGSHVQNCR